MRCRLPSLKIPHRVPLASDCGQGSTPTVVASMRCLGCVALLLLVASVADATDYFVKPDGDDRSSGSSDVRAWKTIARVNTGQFAPGDTVYFRRGGTWREQLCAPSSGTADRYLSFKAYGTGPRPKILGSIRAANWTRVTGNIWTSPIPVTDPYAGVDHEQSEIWFELADGHVTRGHVKKKHLGNDDFSNLTAEYDWTWAGGRVYVYSTSNPDDRYAAVEVPQRLAAIELKDKEYLAFAGLELRYARNRGITETSYPNRNLSGLTVEDCRVCYIGKIGINSSAHGISATHSHLRIRNNEIFEIGRRSISVYHYAPGFNIHDIVIEGNTLHDGYHTTGVDLATKSTGGMDSVIIRNNYMADPPTKNEIGEVLEDYLSELTFISEDGPGIIQRVKIYNNIFVNPSNTGIHIMNATGPIEVSNNTFYGMNQVLHRNTMFVTCNYVPSKSVANHGPASSNVILKNNLFLSNANFDVNTTAICVYLSGNTPPSCLAADYNLYYQVDSRLPVYQIGKTRYPMSGWGTLKEALNGEAHSPVPQDPQLISTTDLHLRKGSPASGAGANLGIATDYAGVQRAPTTAIGAYEYVPE